MLRDRLVCGTSHKTTQRRLLQESDLTFEKALQVALSTEAADTDSKRLTNSGFDKDQPAPIGKVKELCRKLNRIICTWMRRLSPSSLESRNITNICLDGSSRSRPTINHSPTFSTNRNTPACKGNRRYKSNRPQQLSQNKQQQGSDNSCRKGDV